MRYSLLLLAFIGCHAEEKKSAPAPKARGTWTLGILAGPSIWSLAPPAGVTNPVLTPADVTDLEGADTVAHPFMAVTGSRYYLFFTVKNQKAKTGAIGLAESADGLKWTYRKIVVDEPYDLAYPFVFEWQGQWYMIPETHTEPALRLYRAVEFPHTWTYERDLLTGDKYISATLVQFQDRWWMFTARPGNATLRLFHASDPKGPWTEHPRSPIVGNDLNIARPAGRPVVIDGTLHRLAQDCYPTYGNSVVSFRVTEISRTAYREEKIETPLVQASSKGWNSEGMHQLDAHPAGAGRWIAAVDALGK